MADARRLRHGLRGPGLDAGAAVTNPLDEAAVWWTAGRWRDTGKITMVRAYNVFDAAVAMGLAVDRAFRVSACTPPYLVDLAQAHPEMEAWEQHVESMPSAYDRFKHTDRPGWDYQAMEDAGYDIS